MFKAIEDEIAVLETSNRKKLKKMRKKKKKEKKKKEKDQIDIEDPDPILVDTEDPDAIQDWLEAQGVVEMACASFHLIQILILLTSTGSKYKI